MFEKNTIITSAILAGLVSGIALADEPKAEPTGAPSVEKKNSCKGHHKDSCKGHKDSCKGKKGAHPHKMKGEKNACSGPNGCDGMDPKNEGGTKAPPTAQ